MTFDFDELRGLIERYPASRKIKNLRLYLFDLYRYAEDYENLYKIITDIGVIIE